jgi:hypothetical protein
MTNFIKGWASFSAAVALSAVVWIASRTEKPPITPPGPSFSPDESIVQTVNQHLTTYWQSQSIPVAPAIDDLTFLRRTSLGIVGSVPSLEEIRWFEAQPTSTRRRDWVERLLRDRRFSEFTAERLLEAWLPREVGDNFVLYRRLRFLEWLTDQLDASRPFDDLARDMIAGTGVWTDSPEVNFITAFALEPESLAGQTTRIFLGLRLDCAQCHDHPFAPWKQTQFRGLAAHFGTVRYSLRGVTDDAKMYRFDEEDGKAGVVVEPAFPYGMPDDKSTRSFRRQLADWVVSPDNDRFAQAAANRVWHMLVGQALVEPVDNLDGAVAIPGLLPILADDFRRHRHDVRRLFRVIIASDAFVRSSSLDGDADDASTRSFAAFPTVRLTPAQIARSVIQVSSLRTIDGETGVLRRIPAFFERQDFVRLFRNNTDDRASTVAQRLMLMNDTIIRDRLKPEGGSSTERIAKVADNPSLAIETAFLVCLTRHPTSAETTALAAQIEPSTDRAAAVEDLLWALVNSTEFSWLR